MLDNPSAKIRAQWFSSLVILAAGIIFLCAAFSGCHPARKAGAPEPVSQTTSSSLAIHESDWRQPAGQAVRGQAEATSAAASLATTSQTQTTTSGAKSNHASRRNDGSAAVLSGTVCLLSVYVSDAASSWPLKDLAEVEKRLKDTQDFILDQARLDHIAVRFAPATSVTVWYEGNIPTDMWASPKWTETVIQQAARRLSDSCSEENLKSANDLMRFLKKIYAADQALTLIHVNKSATSYNLTFYKGVGATYQAERSVMFMRYAKGNPTCAASYVHEILHNFGAGELYFPFDKESVRKDQAKKLWPNEIMYRVDYNLGKLTLGEYTAYRIGWLDRMNPEYKKFDD
ncbi:MAG: hypothetical protein NTX50_06625 [Candidatus Sumerlaeota bacterium]|nr:hypothetical protein [Candidatus Sumerlaeota bacterium]